MSEQARQIPGNLDRRGTAAHDNEIRRPLAREPLSPPCGDEKISNRLCRKHHRSAFHVTAVDDASYVA